MAPGNNNIDIRVCARYLLIGHGSKMMPGILVGIYDPDLAEDIDSVSTTGVNLIEGYLAPGLCSWWWSW